MIDIHVKEAYKLVIYCIYLIYLSSEWTRNVSLLFTKDLFLF